MTCMGLYVIGLCAINLQINAIQLQSDNQSINQSITQSIDFLIGQSTSLVRRCDWLIDCGKKIIKSAHVTKP